MGTEYRAVVVVGLPYSELNTKVSNLDDEMEDCGELDRVSPYFDAPNEGCVIGFVACQSPDYGAVIIDDKDDLSGLIFKAEERWESRFPGVKPKLYLMPYGW